MEYKTPFAARLKMRIWRMKLRVETLMIYSLGEMRCACCGSKDELELDHIDGRGKAHRQKVFGRKDHISSDRMYSWLKRNNWPKGFQVLCSSCNNFKGNTKKCPCGHKGLEWLPNL